MPTSPDNSSKTKPRPTVEPVASSRSQDKGKPGASRPASKPVSKPGNPTRRRSSSKTPPRPLPANKRAKLAGSPTEVALRFEAALHKRPPGRPSRLTPELADRILNAVASGSATIVECRKEKIDPPTFYRWLKLNEEFSNRLDEAVALRAKLAGERLWALSLDETDVNATGRRTAASMIERAMAFQAGGMNSYRQRGSFEGERASQTPIAPIVQINFGRPDKPADWDITKDFPELGDQKAGEPERKAEVIDAKAIELQKSGYFGGE